MSALDPARWASLGPQIDELLGLALPQRQRRLDEIAADDPARAAELRDLLRARDAASDIAFLGAHAAPTLLPIGAGASDALGAWTLVEAIGEGGMGSVWRARRNDGRFDGEAAIKLLRSGQFDTAAQERFRREGAILAHLRHPGIAQLSTPALRSRASPTSCSNWCAASASTVGANRARSVCANASSCSCRCWMRSPRRTASS